MAACTAAVSARIPNEVATARSPSRERLAASGTRPWECRCAVARAIGALSRRRSAGRSAAVLVDQHVGEQEADHDAHRDAHRGGEPEPAGDRPPHAGSQADPGDDLEAGRARDVLVAHVRIALVHEHRLPGSGEAETPAYPPAWSGRGLVAH